ncbi:MAG: polysaccharide deacetylase family protein [Desulfomonilia bacterium]
MRTKRETLLTTEAKERIYQGVAITRLPWLLNRTVFRKAHTVITYHGVRDRPLPIDDECFISRDRFISQLLYAKRHFNVVPLSEAVERTQARADSGGRPLLSITFDDGFQNVHDITFPILKRLGLPATVFLVTGLIDTDRTIWYCALNHALERTRMQSFTWRGHRYDLAGPGSRSLASRGLQERLKKLPQKDLVRETRAILSALGFEEHVKVPEDSPFRILSSKAIRDMHSSGLIEFGAHTHTHSILSLLPEAEQEREILSSINRVSECTGRPCTLFSYPNGEEGDFSPVTRMLLARHRVRCSVTMMRGPNYPGSDPYSYRRYGIENGMGMHRFVMNVHHMVWVKRSLARAGRSMAGKVGLDAC